jgi:hypothetical protein
MEMSSDLALMFLDKLFRLHKHAAGTAAGIKHAAFVRFQHIHQQFDNAARGIELAALLAFRQREFAEEIFEHMAEHIGTAGFGVPDGDIADQVDQFTQ